MMRSFLWPVGVCTASAAISDPAANTTQPQRKIFPCPSASPSRPAINTKLTHQLLPIEADGCVAVPTAPGLGIDLDEDVFSSLRVEVEAR